MKIGTTGKILIAIGVLVILSALAMDVTLPGAEVINLQLMDNRRTAMMLGIALFLSGIILYAVHKNKITREEEIAEEKLKQEKINAIKSDSREKINASKGRIAKIWSGYRSDYRDLQKQRMRVAFFVGITTFIPAAVYLGFYGAMLIAIIIFVIAFMNTKGKGIVMGLYLFNGLQFGAYATYIMSGLIDGKRFDFVATQAVIPLVPSVISFVMFFRSKKLA